MKLADYIAHEEEFRGSAAINKRANTRIVLCGAGAVGSFAGDLMVRQGYVEIRVIDRDKVEAKNVGTQNFDPTDLGRNKAVQTVNKWVRRYGVRGATAKPDDLTVVSAEKLLKGHELVVDVFDNQESRLLVRDVCTKLKIPCVHAGMASNGFCEVRWNDGYYVADSNDEDGPCEYPLAANQVFVCAAMLVEVINCFVETGEKREVDFWLKSLKMGI